MATALCCTEASPSQPCCPQLTVRRWRPCLKSLIPASLLSMHSRPPHWAITPAILYTSSSSSSSSGREEKTQRTKRGEDRNKSESPECYSPLLGWGQKALFPISNKDSHKKGQYWILDYTTSFPMELFLRFKSSKITYSNRKIQAITITNGKTKQNQDKNKTELKIYC